jgi:hypothetical protein
MSAREGMLPRSGVPILRQTGGVLGPDGRENKLTQRV